VTANLVFTSAEGRAIERNHWNRYQWKPAVKTAGIPVARDNGFHALRHHYASSLLRNGWTSGRWPRRWATMTRVSPCGSMRT
jgi:integrase